jgi:hypothetical protein
MDSLSVDVLSLVFDAMDSETTSSTAAMSRVSRAWNEAWYNSRHWRRRIKVPKCHDATALVAAMRKTGWRAEDIELTGPAELFETVLANFANLKSLSFAVSSDSSSSIRAPEKKTMEFLRSLRLLGGVPDVVVNRVVVPAAFPALEHLTLAGLADYARGTRNRQPSVRASEFPKSLRSLELSKCSRVFVMDASLPHLESLTATDLEWDFVVGGRVRREDDFFPGTYVYVPHEEYRCPNLKTLRVKNSGVDVFATAGTTMLVESPSLSSAIYIKTIGDAQYEKKTFDTEKATLDLGGGEKHSLYVLNDDVYTVSFEENDRDDDEPKIVHIEPNLHRESRAHLYI